MQRLWNLDLLRIIAISAVVVIHTTQNMGKLDVYGFDWAVLNVYDGLVRWAVPVFVMISGVLFLNPAKEQPLKKLYSKNVLRIVTIILFWGLVYAALNHPPADLSFESLYAFFRTAVLGHYHMWFLYMIAGLYILVPPLRCIAASPKTLDYFLAVAFVLNMALPFLTSFGHLSLITQLTDNMLFQMPLGYSFYFLLGFWLSQRDFTRKQETGIYLLGIAGVAATILLTYAPPRRPGNRCSPTTGTSRCRCALPAPRCSCSRGAGPSRRAESTPSSRGFPPAPLASTSCTSSCWTPWRTRG